MWIFSLIYLSLSIYLSINWSIYQCIIYLSIISLSFIIIINLSTIYIYQPIICHLFSCLAITTNYLPTYLPMHLPSDIPTYLYIYFYLVNISFPSLLHKSLYRHVRKLGQSTSLFYHSGWTNDGHMTPAGPIRILLVVLIWAQRGEEKHPNSSEV